MVAAGRRFWFARVVNARKTGLKTGLTIALGLALGIAIAALTAPQFGCNDGSTGCCVVCNGTCACGDSCVPCGQMCTKPKGCACTSSQAAIEIGVADAGGPEAP